jgi:hypothetical protein
MYNLFYYAGSTVIGWLGGVAYLWFGWGGTVSMVIAFAAFSGMLILWFAKSHGGFAAIDAQSQSRE